MANKQQISDRPNTSHQKVDFETILVRRGRSAVSYVSNKGFKTAKAVNEHLKVLSKEYIVSERFEKACLGCVAVSKEFIKNKPLTAPEAAAKQAREELDKSIASDGGYSFFDENEKKKTPAVKKKTTTAAKKKKPS